MHEIKINVTRAIFGGCFVAAIILAGGWWVASAGGYEAFQLFKTILPATRSFSSTLIMALSAILALMLTLLSISVSLEVKIKSFHFRRIKQISSLITVTLIIGVLTSLLLNIPIIESEKKTLQWFKPLYYGTLVISSLLGGAFITITLLLYNTIRNIINIFQPGGAKDVVQKEEEE